MCFTLHSDVCMFRSGVHFYDQGIPSDTNFMADEKKEKEKKQSPGKEMIVRASCFAPTVVSMSDPFALSFLFLRLLHSVCCSLFAGIHKHKIQFIRHMESSFFCSFANYSLQLRLYFFLVFFLFIREILKSSWVFAFFSSSCSSKTYSKSTQWLAARGNRIIVFCAACVQSKSMLCSKSSTQQ